MANNRKLVRTATQDNFVTEKIDVITNNLLGNYDDNGNYSIAPQIISELVELKKFKKTSFANSVFCVGRKLGYGELVFELLFDSKSHNGKSISATLYLLEEVDKISGYIQNTIKTKLEDYNEDVDNFMAETYSHFNILMSEEDDEDSEVLERKLKDDIYNEDSYIIAKKQYSLMLDKLLEEKFLDAYGKYFTARISALTKVDNDFSRTILSSFNNQYALIQNVFLQEKNYKVLNELLDKCFEEHTGVNPMFANQEQEFSNVIKPALDSFVDNVNRLNDKYEHKALNMLDSEDRHKVEEILDEQVTVAENVDDIVVKPSAEQIINDVKASKDIEESQKIDNQDEKHYIDTIKEKAESSQKVPDAKFYDSFKDSHATSSDYVSDNSQNEQQTQDISYMDSLTAESLMGRGSRLEKFKQQSPSTPDSKTYNSPTSFYDVLTKQRSIKGVQSGEKNRRAREDLEKMIEEEQLQHDKTTQQNPFFEYDDFTK